MPIGALAAPLITSALVDAGVGAGLAGVGGAVGGAALSAGAGAGLGALTGQGAGPGALVGGLSGLGGAAGSAVGNLAGFPGIGGAVGGALGGALGSTISGGSPLVGGIEGAAFGAPSPVSLSTGGFGGGIGAAVPADATAGAVQPLGTPLSGLDPGFATALNDAPFTGGAGGGTTGNVGPWDVGGGDMTTGPAAGSTVQMDIATQQPLAPAGGGIPQTGTTVTPSLVGPTGGVMTPPADAPAAAPAGATGTTWWGEPVSNVQTAPGVGTDPNVTWFGEATAPGEAAYNAAPGASKGVLGNIADMIKNPLGLATAGAGLYQMITAKQAQAGELKPLQTAATGAGGMATALASPSMTGILPVGEAEALENERRKKFAAIEGQARATGMSGSTMERDAKIQANADIAQQQVGIEQDLLKGSYQYSALQSTDLTNILRAKQQQDADYANALARFAAGLASLGGTPRSTTTTTTSTA